MNSHPAFAVLNGASIASATSRHTAGSATIRRIGAALLCANQHRKLRQAAHVLEPSPQISPGCGPPVSTTNSSFMVAVPAYSTVHLTFPSPLIFSAVNGHTCVRLYIDANASLGVLLNGYGN